MDLFYLTLIYRLKRTFTSPYSQIQSHFPQMSANYIPTGHISALAISKYLLRLFPNSRPSCSESQLSLSHIEAPPNSSQSQISTYYSFPISAKYQHLPFPNPSLFYCKITVSPISKSPPVMLLNLSSYSLSLISPSSYSLNITYLTKLLLSQPHLPHQAPSLPL